MLEDMDDMEASCVLYVEVGTFNQLEPSKICVLTITILGKAVLTRVSKRSGYPTSSLGSNRDNFSVRFQTPPTTLPTVLEGAKPGSVPVNPPVLSGLGRPVGSNLWFQFWVFHLWSHSDILLLIAKY